MKLNRASATILLIAALAGGIFLVRSLKIGAAPKYGIEQRSKGDKNAKIKIVEYFDYQCPPCAKARVMLDERMAEKPGSILLDVRYFPLPGHKNALKAAVHAECALRQGRFWDYHGKLLDQQMEWANDPYAELKFLTYAQDLGLDLKQWDVCTKDESVAEFIGNEKKEAQAAGVTITPTFFINDKLVVGNFPMIEELKQLESKETLSP